ncbi:CTP synthase ura7 [Bachmanniomyces sp. S44760]|nr:CTP synthase ura7 [Bachmanniomyces sp. S44760]
MAPTEHGEVFVLDDGGEVDLDLGNYERYLNITLTRENNITTGKIYLHVIERERKGDYLGRTVQVVPHLTDAIQDWIERVARIPVDDTNQEPNVCIIELGGTVGDIESGPFIEAMRQLRRRAGKDNFLQIHVSLIPVVNREQKTKPTQQAIRDVRSAGLSPDLIACRCSEPLEKSTTDKIAMFCQVETSQVVAVHDVSSTYHVPLLLENQGLITLLRDILRLDLLTISPTLVKRGSYTWNAWKTLTTSQDHLYESVTIALVGKYTNLHDSYLSVIKSLEHAAMACSKMLNLVWVDASKLEPAASSTSPAEYHKAWHELCTAQGILVPGGFGHRGTEGMIAAASWARKNNIPYLGICLGMQIAVIEFARNVCHISDAASTEFDERTKDPLVIFMPEIDKTTLGGTMRLGLRPTHFQPGSEWSKLRALYGEMEKKDPVSAPIASLSSTNLPVTPAKQTAAGNRTNSTTSTLPHDPPTVQQSPTTPSPSNPRVLYSPEGPIILERHRHRYEVNPAYVSRLASAGLTFIGKDDSGERMEILELKDHPWFVGVQFHPEYLSRVLEPSRPYLGFVAAASGCLAEVVRRSGRGGFPLGGLMSPAVGGFGGGGGGGMNGVNGGGMVDGGLLSSMEGVKI